jgi:hypothetical protein
MFDPTYQVMSDYGSCRIGSANDREEDRSRERREDHAGLLKLEMPADVVQDSDGANQSEMVHNPTLSSKKQLDRRLRTARGTS